MLSFSRVSNLPDDLPDWIRAEASVKRHAAAVREAAVLLEAADMSRLCGRAPHVSGLFPT